MKGLGYRQKAILELFADKPLPVGYLVRRTGADPKTVHMALQGLAGRGVVRRVRWGVWELDGAEYRQRQAA